MDMLVGMGVGPQEEPIGSEWVGIEPLKGRRRYRKEGEDTFTEVHWPLQLLIISSPCPGVYSQESTVQMGSEPGRGWDTQAGNWTGL